MSRSFRALLMLAALTPSSLYAQGILSRTRGETHHGPSGPSSSDSSSSNDNTIYTGEDPDAEGTLLALGLGAAIALPFLPAAVLDDRWDDTASFPCYPYPNNRDGYISFGRWASPDSAAHDPEELKGWSLRLAAEEGNDFRGLNRVETRVTVDTETRFGLQSNWSLFSEDLGSGRRDQLVLGDTNMTFRVAQKEWISVYGGLGTRFLVDKSDTRFGFNGLYGMDLFPTKPLILSTSFDLGNLDNAFVVHGRATLGAVHKHYEIYGGYDFLRVGTVNLQGPMAGLRLWF